MTTPRIASMDILRGVAVMGILVANLPAFALPDAAYFSPLAWGGSTGSDRWVWLATYVLVEGKMRGLFTLLFGASMLLVMDRAVARGDDPASVHFRRMAALALIGAIHLYAFWSGDILLHYAMVGSIAFMFARLPIRWLLVVAALLIALATVSNAMATLAFFGSAARDTPGHVATWNAFASGFGVPPRSELLQQVAAIRGGFLDAAIHRWRQETGPLTILSIIGPQTLSAMLIGMAGYRSGFLIGAWDRARYRRWAMLCLGVAAPLYLLLGIHTIAQGFFPSWVFVGSVLAAEPLRPVMTIGYAALLMLAMRSASPPWARIAAAGRMALSNYLGTTLMMTFVFSGWGLGQFGRWSRAELYWLVPLAWALMLLWSTPWLARYRYGPVEWLWSSMARWEWQPMRGAADATS